MAFVGRKRLPVVLTVTFCSDAQQKGNEDKTDDAFFFRGENEPVSHLVPTPSLRQFH